MTQSGVFTDQGATWSDAVDGTGSIGGYNSGSLDVNTAGTYVVGYVYVDASGNTGSVSRTVNVIAPDLTAPIVSLVGVSPVSVEYASSFVDPGATWTDNVDGTGSIASFNSGSININVLWSYVIEYIYVDVGGNTGSVSRTVNVVDTTAPVVSLVGGNPISLILGSTYTESGALWTDNVDGSGSIVSPYSGGVNTWAIGSYILQYRQIDTSGNTGTISRTINVLGAPDITPPVVSLSGSGIINIEFGSVYTELGATWMDNVDGTGNTFGWIYGAPGSFTITGSVNTGILWGYTITYRKIDSSGNTGSMNRTVNVVDTTVPTVTLQYSNTGMTNGTVTVTLTGVSEPINILNNSGSNTYTFSSNWSFTFLYSDLSGNTGSSTATVANIDITPPMIVLNGSSNISVYQWSVYVDAGATANDNVSWNITNALSVSGSVNTSILWNYTLLYTVSDGVGNLAIPAVRTVTVIANIPVIETVTGGGWGGGGSSIGSMISYVNAVFESAPTRITTQISQISYGEGSMTLWLPWLMRILREKIEKESARNYMEPANTVPAIKIVTSEKIGPNIVEMIEKWYIRNVKDLRLQAKISRAEFIKIISLMNGYTDEGQQYKTPYKDVSDNSEFARYIDFARSRSWINTKQEYFRPGDTISLWEATKIMRSITGWAIPKKDTDSQKSLNREEAINIISKELSWNEQG